MKIAIDINDVLRDYTNQFIRCYNKIIDPFFKITSEEITDFDFFNVFPFVDSNGNQNKELYYKFKYEDAAFDLFGRADVTERRLISDMILWIQNTLRNFDEDKIPEVMIVSPFEMNLSIQSTLSFLAKMGNRVREIYFPIDSSTIWDKCDLLITANPNLISSVPDNKVVFKINAPYNKEINTKYSYNSIIDIIHDKDNTLLELIENFGA